MVLIHAYHITVGKEMQSMKKSILILCVITCILFIFNFNICYANDVIEINSDDVTEIEIHAGGPMYLDHLKYNYQTSSPNEIKYLINLLTSLSLTDDGSCVYANDVPIYYISIKQNDDTVIKYIFEACRFTGNNGKQYVADLNEYNRFLETVYALKNKLLKLPDDISFEPSEWARDDIDRSIKTGLLPKLNRIDYTGDITCLEVCELADSLIEKINPVEDIDAENPFSDTKNKSVVSLYNLGIIQGKSESEFKPYDFITREEFAKILMSVYEYTVNDKEESKSGFDFADENEISDWAKESVKSCACLGLFRGDEKGKFNPKDNISKEECIVTLNRLYKIAES